MSPLTVGVALDGTHLSVVWRERGTRDGWSTMWSSCDGTPDAIERTLLELGPRAPTTETVSVTLLSPLAHARALSLPRMPRDAIGTVLARDWSRYVIGHRPTPHTVTVQPTDRGRWLATFAPADVVEAITRAAEEIGWRTLDIRSGDDSIAAAARARAPQDARAKDSIVVISDASGPAFISHLRGGSPWRGRRFGVTANEADVAEFTRASVGAGGSAPPHIRIRAADVGIEPEASSIDLMAVAGTLGPATLPLRSAHAHQVRARQSRATTRWLAIAAGVALLAGLALERWRIQRDLADVQRERALIAAPANTAIAQRASIEGTTDAVRELAERESNASRVSSVIAAVAVAIPAGSTLTAIRVAGDSVTVEGESTRSAAVYEALRAVSSLEQVKLAAPLRQERRGDENAVELFAFSARVRQ